LHTGPELAHLRLHGLKLCAGELGLDLRRLLRIARPNKPRGHVQRSMDILLAVENVL